jgi:hypothetical protein
LTNGHFDSKKHFLISDGKVNSFQTKDFVISLRTYEFDKMSRNSQTHFISLKGAMVAITFIPVSLALSVTPLDGMLVHHRLAFHSRLVPINTPAQREASRTNCLAQGPFGNNMGSGKDSDPSPSRQG